MHKSTQFIISVDCYERCLSWMEKPFISTVLLLKYGNVYISYNFFFSMKMCFTNFFTELN